MTKTVKHLQDDIEFKESTTAGDDSDENIEEDDDTDVEREGDDAWATSHKIYHMRCAAHTLQLAIRDGLKIPEVRHILSKTRNVVKKLRTPQMIDVIRTDGGLLPIIDVVTRWGSTYLMLERIVSLQTIINKYLSVHGME